MITVNIDSLIELSVFAPKVGSTEFKIHIIQKQQDAEIVFTFRKTHTNRIWISLVLFLDIVFTNTLHFAQFPCRAIALSGEILHNRISENTIIGKIIGKPIDVILQFGAINIVISIMPIAPRIPFRLFIDNSADIVQSSVTIRRIVDIQVFSR